MPFQPDQEQLKKSRPVPESKGPQKMMTVSQGEADDTILPKSQILIKKHKDEFKAFGE